MKTTDLGESENLKKLNYLVAKITGHGEIRYFHGSPRIYDVLNERNGDYSPTTNAEQCLAATPYCNVNGIHNISPYSMKSWRAIMHCKKSFEMHDPFVCHADADTELIARCLALVYSVYGEEVDDKEFL